MAGIILKLNKEDIDTSKMGINIMVSTDKFDLVFSREALEELISDYNTIKKLDEEL
jgi:hypothetical protein